MAIHIHIHTTKTRDARSLEEVKKEYLSASDLSTYSPHDKLNRSKSKLEQLLKEAGNIHGGSELVGKIQRAIKQASELLAKTPQQLGSHAISPSAPSNMTTGQQGRRAQRGSNFF